MTYSNQLSKSQIPVKITENDSKERDLYDSWIQQTKRRWKGKRKKKVDYVFAVEQIVQKPYEKLSTCQMPESV